ncbi:MAG: hypothetical protein D6761_05630 [Candidatus Dadabacteria bacterium]|nr:MAG: hypothetical protein D6761_05630 [Candidatus Dadabacteria bacterium]
MRNVLRSILAIGLIGALQGAGGDFFGCVPAPGEPELIELNPQAGLPGTLVVISGTNLLDPLNDPDAHVLFDGIEIYARQADQIDPAAGVIKFWGPDRSNPELDRIEFLTPVRNPSNRIVAVQVVNRRGTSNALPFYDGDLSAAAACLEENSVADCVPFDDFVGAVILQDDDEVELVRLSRVGPVSSTDPTLSPKAWNDQEETHLISIPVSDVELTLHDVRVDAVGQAVVSLTQRATTDPFDGLDGALVLDDQYSRFATDIVTGLNPTRIVSQNLGNPLGNRRLAILAKDSAEVSLLSGELYSTRSTLSLVGLIGPDARPTGGAFVDDTLLTVGYNAVNQQAWLAALSVTDGSAEVADLGMDGARPVDVALRAWQPTTTSSQTIDVYIAMNRVSGATTDAVILRLRNPGQVSETTATITIPNTRVRAMLLDTSSAFGHRLTTNNTVIPQLWLTLDDLSAADDDRVAAIRLESSAFSTTAATWNDILGAWSSQAPQAVSDYRAAVSAASAGITVPSEVTAIVDKAVTAPVAPILEVRTTAPGGVDVFDAPFAMSLVPNAVAVSNGPTFLLVTSPGTDNLVVVRTDGVGQGSGGQRLYPAPAATTGYAWATVPFTRPGRLYCIQAVNAP